MRKRIIAAMIALTLLLTVPAFALTVRTTSVKPTLTFDENVANCRVVIFGDTSTDEIMASIKLYEKRYFSKFCMTPVLNCSLWRFSLP